MWQKITAVDLEGAKAALNEKRAQTLSRHAQELNDLDAQIRDVECFERVVEAFFLEHLVPNGAAPEVVS